MIEFSSTCTVKHNCDTPLNPWCTTIPSNAGLESCALDLTANWLHPVKRPCLTMSGGGEPRPIALTNKAVSPQHMQMVGNRNPDHLTHLIDKFKPRAAQPQLPLSTVWLHHQPLELLQRLQQ